MQINKTPTPTIKEFVEVVKQIPDNSFVRLKTIGLQGLSPDVLFIGEKRKAPRTTGAVKRRQRTGKARLSRMEEIWRAGEGRKVRVCT